MSTINVGSALPSGSNTIGNIKLVDTGGTNQLAIDANNNAHVTLYNATNAMAIDSSNNAHVGVWNGANQMAVNSGGNAATNLVQVGGTNIVTGGASGLIAIGGPVASGASNADNPVKVGGAYNSTQPTVTTGQIVDAQYTSRGAAIVATGTDTFTVTANAGTNLNTSLLALESGGNLATLAGGVSSSKYQTNVAQINGVAPTMGNGVSGTGVQRVTIASDSTGQVTLASGANTIGAVTQASGPWTSNITQISGSSISTAATGVQKVGVVGNTGATVDSTVAAGTAPTNAIVTGAVYNSSAPAPTNGQAMALQVDQAGNQRIFPGVALAALSAWNSSTGLNATQTIFSNSGAESVLVQLTQTTTLSAGAVTFEVSYDGSNWSTIPASAVLDPTSATFAQISLPYTVQASTNKQFLLNMNGAQGLRVKLSTQITGTGTVTPNYALLPASPADTVIAFSPTAANFNATATIQAVTGTSLAADVSNTELRTSVYGKSSAAGDTPILLDSTGRVLVGRSCVAAYTLASTTTSGSTQNSGDITVGAYTEISIDINTTAQSGTNPTLQLFWERKGADGIYYVLWQSAVLTAATNTLSTSVGTGMAYNQSLGLTGRMRWVVGGTSTPTYTMSINIYAK